MNMLQVLIIITQSFALFSLALVRKKIIYPIAAENPPEYMNAFDADVLMEAVIKSVYWFNPAVHLMATQANKDIETVCDVLTVSGMNTDLRKRYSEIEFDSKTGYPSVVRFNTPGPPKMITSQNPDTGKWDVSRGEPDMVIADIQFKDRFSVDGIMFPRVVHWQVPGRQDMELWIQEVQINPNLSLEDFEVPEQ